MSAPSEPRKITLVAEQEEARLDRYLTRTFPQHSRSYIQKLIERGFALINGHPAKASQRLHTGDTLEIEFSSLRARPQPQSLDFATIYEDDDVLVVDKPAGMVVHPAPGHTDHTLVNAILAHCPSLARSDDLLRPGVVHRLDKDTSGLIVVAKHEAAKANLITQFKTREVVKGYLALVKGHVVESRGQITARIGRDPHNRKRMRVIETGKEARTGYVVRAYFHGYTLLDISPTTGRTHQIRVHLSYLGHSVVGDPIYGGRSRDNRISLDIRRQFLHAYRLAFRLPTDQRRVEFTSPLPDDLQCILGELCMDWKLASRLDDLL